MNTKRRKTGARLGAILLSLCLMIGLLPMTAFAQDTSSVFDVISPKDRIKMIKKYSDFTMDKEVSLEDFLKDESNFNRFYEERY